ncbi:LuxR C-terminal-related transcriptional regulator, partial [Streptomyces sp. SID12488]|uniref:helix-turn-helix transcriptional regulator n=1 Tax=Streptomyces sp. SID12488 TaxID=2706040 RepID=UPI0013FB76C6
GPPGVRAPQAALALECGELDEAERLAEEVLAAPDEDRSRTDTLLALGVRAEAALRRGRPREAGPAAGQLVSLLADDRFDLAAGRALRAVLRVTEVEEGSRAVLRVLRELGTPDTHLPGCASVSGAGPDAACACGTTSTTTTPGTGSTTSATAAMSNHRPPSGGGRRAVAGPVPGALLLAGAATAAWLVRLALAADEPELAARIAAQARAVGAARTADATHPVADAASPAADAEAAHAAAVTADHADGLLRESATLLSRAAAAHRDPWSRGRAEEDLGTLLLKDGDDTSRTHAVKRLQAALDAYDAAGCAPDAARVRGTLRGLGVRRRHWTYVDRPVTGWASLTHSERAVADLVAQGLTNRETADCMFLSPYTVNFHLRGIFRKLSITSRVELARMHRDLEQPTAAAAPASPAAAAAERRLRPAPGHGPGWRTRPDRAAAGVAGRSADTAARPLAVPAPRGRWR